MPEPLDWRAALDAEVHRERSRREQLPDLRAVRLSPTEWDARATEAGLLIVFDEAGRPAGPTEHDTYDAAHAQMLAEGRLDEAEAFAAMRPARRGGARPRSCFVDAPDPLRRGPVSRRFELRVCPSDWGLTAMSIRCAVGEGTSTDRWAALARTGESELRASGPWADVPSETFQALVAATAAVFGPTPRFVPSSLVEHARFRHGGTCACCGQAIAGRALSLGLRERSATEALSAIHMHLPCAHHAHPEAVRQAIERHRPGDEELSVIRVLEPGALARCEACRTIVPKGAWRLSAAYAKRALHLRCAVEAEPAGFRWALRYALDFPEAEIWRAALDESR